MPDSAPKKIAHRLIIATILFSSLITLIITIWQLSNQYDREKNEIVENINGIDSVYLPGISTQVWVADKQEMRALLEGMLNIDSVVYLEVAEKGKVWVTVGEKQDEDKIEKTYPITYLHRGRNLHIADLYVQASLKGVHQNLIDEVWGILISNGIKTFLVAGFMFFIFQHYVTRHLNKMAEFANNLTIKTLDSRLKLDRKNAKPGDELDVLVNALESMRTNLADSLAERSRYQQVYRVLAKTPAIEISHFLKDCLQCLAEVFGAKFAMIGRVNPEKTQVNTDALYMHNKIVDNLTYDLVGTPCNEVVNIGPKIVVRNISREFPGDEMLTDLSIESYFGMPLINSHGETIGLVAVLDDKPRFSKDWYEEILGVVAARISMEMERSDAVVALDMHLQSLEDKVRTRTADLQQMYDELETFSYSVSHDLRTPLRAINGFARILELDKASQLDEESRTLLDKINAASKKMGELIDSLLILSRIRRHEIDFNTLDVTGMCHTIFDELLATHDLKRVTIKIQDDIKIDGDAGLIKIALENLIKNSIKFSTEKEAPRIEIGQEKSNASTIVFIKDNGIGFDMKYKENLFKPFQRLHNGIDYSGHGIGLATVSRIVEKHGGRIWAESEPDKGTTMYMEFPLRE